MTDIVIKQVGQDNFGPKFAIKGTCQWAKVFTPDDRFNELGVYSIDIDLPSDEDVEAVKEALQPLAEEAFEEAVKEKPALKKQLSYADFVKERYDEDGEVIGHYVQIRQVAKVFSKKNDQWYDMAPRVVDGKGNEMDGSQLIGNGSEVAVLFQPKGYMMASNKTVGVSLKGLRQVKVLKLEEYGSSDPLADFESDFEADNKGKPEPKKDKPKAAQKPSKPPVDDDDLDDDIPF